MKRFARTLGVFLVAFVVLSLTAAPVARAAEKTDKTEKKTDPKAEKKAAKDKKAEAKAEKKAKTEKVAKAEKPKAEKPKVEKKAGTVATNLPAAEITAGLRAGEEATEGFGDILAPIIWTGSGIFFVNPRTAYTDNSEEEYNIGLGYRHLLDDARIIVGANIYYDYRSTKNDAEFSQLGLGVEFLSEWLDARANYYKPEDKEEKVAEFDVETEQTVYEGSGGAGDARAQGHQIVQDTVSWRTIQTTRQRYAQYETALEGWDCEVGVRLPIPVVMDYADVKVFGGYYRFYDEYDVGDVEGFKGRVEVRALPALYLDYEVYEDELFNGGDWYAGARMSVPFSVPNIVNGRNPFEGAIAGLKLKKKEEPFRSRLTEMVLRDLHVRTEISEGIEEVEFRQQTTNIVKTGGGSVVLVPDVTFVDQDNQTGVEDGSAEHPWSTVGKGVSNVVKTMVYVWDSSLGVYGENVQVPGGLTLWGSGSLIPAPGGFNFGNGIFPVVDGISAGPTLWLQGDNITIAGLKVTHSQGEKAGFVPPGTVIDPAWGYDVTRAGIYGYNVNNALIQDCRVENASYGIVLTANALQNFTAAALNNVVQGCTEDGLNIDTAAPWYNSYLLPAEGVFHVDVSGTYSWNGENGVYLCAEDFTRSEIFVKDVTAQHNSDDGVDVEVWSDVPGSEIIALFDPSDCSDNADSGMDIWLESEAFTLVNFAGITANNNQDGYGIYADIYADNGAAIVTMGLPAGLAAFINSLAGPMELDLGDWPLVATGTGPVVVNGNDEDGIQLDVWAPYVSLAGLFDIQANGNGEDGLCVSVAADVGIAGAVIASSEVLGPMINGALGIWDTLDPDGPPAAPVMTSYGPVQVNGNDDYGIDLYVEGGLAAFAAMLGIQANDNEDGVYADADAPDGILGALVMDRVEANNNDEGGIDVGVDAGLFAVGALFDVNASNNDDDDGIELDVRSRDGIGVGIVASLDPLDTVLGALDGVLWEPGAISFGGLPAWGPVVANNNDGDGITVEVRGYNAALALVMDARANGNDDYGIEVEAHSANGGAVAGVLASDYLLELADAFDTYSTNIPGMETTPIEIPDWTPMGMVEANRNDEGGIRVVADGLYDADAAVIGVQANHNALFGSSDGVNVRLRSETGSVSFVAAFIEANSNDQRGVNVNAEALQDVFGAFVGIDAIDNGAHGVRLEALAFDKSDYYYNEVDVMLGDINASLNGKDGIHLDILGEEEVDVMFADIVASRNTDQGIQGIVFSPEGDIGITMAAMDLVNEYDGPPELLPWVPQGSIVANDNGLVGIKMDLDAYNEVDTVWYDITANDNGGDGVQIDSYSDNNWVWTGFSNVVARGNGGDGIQAVATANGGAAELRFDTVVARTNADVGVRAQITSLVGAELYGRHIVSVSNQNTGVRVNATAPGYNLDLGGGVLGSPGLNSIYGNGNRDLRNAGGGTVMAENNWWGQDPPAAGQFGGSVDYTPWLTSDPNP